MQQAHNSFSLVTAFAWENTITGLCKSCSVTSHLFFLVTVHIYLSQNHVHNVYSTNRIHCEDWKIICSRRVLEHEWFISKDNWRIFGPKGLEDFSSHSSSIICPTGIITVKHTTRLNIITAKLLLHNIVSYRIHVCALCKVLVSVKCMWRLSS